MENWLGNLQKHVKSSSSFNQGYLCLLKLFFRKVTCDATNAVTGTVVCPLDDEVYISDAAESCVKVTSAEAQTACGVTVDCKDTEMAVHVTDAAIWSQTDAPLQFGVNDNDNACNIAHGTGSYDGALSLLASGTG